jgi:hypothetical protein
MTIKKKEYIILKDGKLLETFRPDSLEMAVEVVRHLEAMMDRNTQHSPYTIATLKQWSEA